MSYPELYERLRTDIDECVLELMFDDLCIHVFVEGNLRVHCFRPSTSGRMRDEGRVTEEKAAITGVVNGQEEGIDAIFMRRENVPFPVILFRNEAGHDKIEDDLVNRSMPFDGRASE